jgi:phosphoserine phosphatase
MGEKQDSPALDREVLARILEVTRQLARPLDLQTMLERVIDEGRTVLRADRGTVFLYDSETDELFSTVATGTDTLRIPADRGIVGECARTRRVVNVPDCYADPRFNRDIDRQTGYRSRCLLTVPLIGYDDSLVGILQVLNKDDGVFTEEDEHIATALAAQCAVALQRARMLEDLVTKEKMERELAVARDIQMRVLPREVPDLPGYDVAGWSRPADETGGDIFDIIAVAENHLMLLLGDATGHGIGPALSVTQVRSMLRMCVRLGAGLDNAFRHINDQLADDLASNRFVTAFLGVLDSGGHRLEYHAGGQGPLLRFHAADGKCEWMKASTVPMGLMAGLPLEQPPPMDLAPGDIVALMTDGIYEYENPSEEQFGESRVEAIVRQHHDAPMSKLLERIVASVEEFAEGAPQNDDMTILLVRRLPD